MGLSTYFIMALFSCDMDEDQGQGRPAHPCNRTNTCDVTPHTGTTSVDVVDLCDGNQLSPAGVEAALTLADTHTLGGIDDVEYRINGLADLFAQCEDTRGLFATVYRPITNRAVQAIDAGRFDHDDWVRDLVVDFAGRYFDNLTWELRFTSPEWAWDRYYALAAKEDVSRLRVAAMGVVVHLIVDLPHSLTAIDTQEVHYDDFMLFGDLLVSETDVIIDDLWQDYRVDSEDLFTGFFLGDWIDGAFGSSTTSAFAFQTIRTKAWNNRWYLQQWWGEAVAEGEISVSFWTLDGILKTLDGAGTI